MHISISFALCKLHVCTKASLTIVIWHWLTWWCTLMVFQKVKLFSHGHWLYAASVFISMHPQLLLSPWLDLCWGSNFPRVLCYSLWSVLILMCKNSHGRGLMIFAHLVCHNNRLCLLCATNRRTRMEGEKSLKKRILQGEAFCKSLHPLHPTM